ncbi:11632_t:CDS:2, partial [Ambispora gerdemannii]
MSQFNIQCVYFKAGFCKKGDSCPFLHTNTGSSSSFSIGCGGHNNNSLSNAIKKDYQFVGHPQVCKFFNRPSGCARGTECSFLHEHPELYKSEPTSKAIVIDNEKDALFITTPAVDNKRVTNLEEICYNEVTDSVDNEISYEDPEPMVIDDFVPIPVDVSAFRSKYQMDDLIFLGEESLGK